MDVKQIFGHLAASLRQPAASAGQGGALVPALLAAAHHPGVRRWLQPLAFVGASLALLGLVGLGVVSATLLLLAAGLIVAILQQVFGIEMGLTMPPGFA